MPAPAASPSAARHRAAGAWVIPAGVAATLAGTTLALGGYLAGPMVAASRAVWGLTVLGGALFALRPRPLHPAAFAPVPFLLFALGSVLWIAPAPWLAWREWLLWLQTWLVFVLVLHFGRGRGPARLLAGSLIGLALTGVALAAYQRHTDPGWLMLGRAQATQFLDRSAGMFGIPNSLAGLLELLLPAGLCCAAARRVPVTGRVFAGWCAAAGLYGLMLTGSRGGWLATGAVLVLAVMLRAPSLRRAVFGGGAAVAGLVAAGAALYFGSPAARARITPFLTGEFELSRPLMWRAAGQLWLDRPWLGTGAASYNVLYDRHRVAADQTVPDWAHNDYLNTLSDYGLVGFLLWAGAAAWLGWRGWRAVRTNRLAPAGGSPRDPWRWGLWLGLVAWALHLGVDFHTKIPGLAFAAAVTAGLVLRPATAAAAPAGRWAGAWARGFGVGLIAVALAAGVGRADALYRAEAMRHEARRQIDRVAEGRAELGDVLPRALLELQEAVHIDPANGQAWADLSYASTLSWHLTRSGAAAIGRRAEAAATRALGLCDQRAEFHARRGVALDMQGRPAEAAPSFARAVRLAPNTAEWRYYLAYHLSLDPATRAEATAAAATCLALDPSHPQAKALRDRLSAGQPGPTHRGFP